MCVVDGSTGFVKERIAEFEFDLLVYLKQFVKLATFMIRFSTKSGFNRFPLYRGNHFPGYCYFSPYHLYTKIAVLSFRVKNQVSLIAEFPCLVFLLHPIPLLGRICEHCRKIYPASLLC